MGGGDVGYHYMWNEGDITLWGVEGRSGLWKLGLIILVLGIKKIT